MARNTKTRLKDQKESADASRQRGLALPLGKRKLLRRWLASRAK